MGARLWLVLVGVMGSILLGVAGENSSAVALTAKLETVLPKSWSVAERKPGALPEGHYWGQEYNGVRGEEILLQGGADVHVSWQDGTGDWHSDVVGKEALKLYVMPSTYRESWLRFLIPKRPVAARLLVETPSFKVYAYPSFRITESEKLDQIVKQGKAIRWPDSPENTGSLSWGTWVTDILRTLKSG